MHTYRITRRQVGLGLTLGTYATQPGSPPFKSLECTIPVKFTTALTNAGCCSPPYIKSGNVACTGPPNPWNSSTESAPFARCWSFGGENASAFFMYEKRESQFQPVEASEGRRREERASYWAARARVHVAPLMELLPPRVLPLKASHTI